MLARNPDGGFRAVSTHGLELAGASEGVAAELHRGPAGGGRRPGRARVRRAQRSAVRGRGEHPALPHPLDPVRAAGLARRAASSTSTTAALRPFQPGDLEFVTALAVYAALALERALELTQAAEALEQSADRLDVLQGELLRHRIVGSAPPLLQAYDALRRFAQAAVRACSCAARPAPARSCSRARTPRRAGGPAARTSRSRSPRWPRGSWSRSCSATCAAPSPRPRATRRAGSRWRTAACSSSTRSATSSRRCR